LLGGGLFFMGFFFKFCPPPPPPPPLLLLPCVNEVCHHLDSTRDSMHKKSTVPDRNERTGRALYLTAMNGVGSTALVLSYKLGMKTQGFVLLCSVSVWGPWGVGRRDGAFVG
jgi:hypothetical protein